MTLTSKHTTGKTIALIRQTFVGKVMSLFFNKLPRLIITFLPRSECLLISWLQYSININGVHTHTHTHVSPALSTRKAWEE